MPIESFTNTAEVERLARLFREKRLPRPEWTHRAHLCVALRYLLDYSEAETVERMRGEICAYNEATGMPNTATRGYHHTLTCFWVRTTARFYETADKTLPLHTLANQLNERCGDARLPLRYWERDVLMSPHARREWLEPDKEPLP